MQLIFERLLLFTKCCGPLDLVEEPAFAPTLHAFQSFGKVCEDGVRHIRAQIGSIVERVSKEPRIRNELQNNVWNTQDDLLLAPLNLESSLILVSVPTPKGFVALENSLAPFSKPKISAWWRGP